MSLNNNDTTLLCNPATLIEKSKNYPLQASITCIAGKQTGYVFSIHKQKDNIIGSSVDSDMHIVDNGVSRTHSCIKHANKKYFIEDLNSKNGTYLNGDKIDKALELHNCDQISVGSSTVLQFNLSNLLGANYITNMRKNLVRDNLTNIFNKRAFVTCLQQEFELARHFEKSLSLLMLDIDHFKRINDHYGHLAGDKILKQLGAFLLDNFRSTDYVCRFGGEEFSAVCPDTNGPNGIKLAENIRASVENHGFEVNNTEQLRITVSVGVATCFGDKYSNIQDFINSADKALYRAKKRGRNCMSVSF